MKDKIQLYFHLQEALFEFEKRFIHKSTGLPLNYAGPDGTVLLPTEEEVQQGKPSMLSWNCPVEDGAYYGGLYLSALVDLALYSDLPVQGAAKRVADGLISLSETETDGFVARNYVGNHKVHYAIGSNDQTFPWFYGLWKYCRSTLPSPDDKTRMIRALVRVAGALENLGWKIPSDPLDVGFRGDYASSTINDVAKILFIHRALYDLTADEKWLEKYKELMHACPDGSDETRLEIIRSGAGFTPHVQGTVFYCIKDGEAASDVFGREVSITRFPFFTKAMVDIALRGLIDMETDAETCRFYREGLQKDAQACVSHLDRYKDFDEDAAPSFSPNWRVMNALWHEHHTAKEANDIAWSQMPVWFRECPRFPYENAFVREPLFSGLVVALDHENMQKSSLNKIEEMLMHYNWKSLCTSTFYVAFCIYGQLLSGKVLS